jgi:hypothetical protein
MQVSANADSAWAAGARQEAGEGDRNDHPRQHEEFQRTRHAVPGEEHRKCAERQQAPAQTRRHEGDVALRRRRIMARGRMHQRIEKIANGRRSVHDVKSWLSLAPESETAPSLRNPRKSRLNEH